MDELYTTVYEKLSTLQWLMRRQMFSQTECAPFADTTRGQGRVLAMLKIQPEIATKDLAYLLGIRQQSLNELLNKLEKSGFVERKPSEADRRVMMVHLTVRGKSVQQPTTDYQENLSCLSQEELKQFNSYLDRLIAAFGIDEKAPDGEEWMDNAKNRMGDDAFERLMSMRDRAFGPFGRRGCPGGIPGPERFSPHYDGPVPNRRGFGSLNGRKEEKEE